MVKVHFLPKRVPGEQPEADPRSQTQVNTIRPFKATSLLETGEVRSFWSILGASHLSLKVRSWALGGGWCENAGKVSCGRNESWRQQEFAQAKAASSQSRHSSVEAGESWWSQGRQEVEPGEEPPPSTSAKLPSGLEKHGLRASVEETTTRYIGAHCVQAACLKRPGKRNAGIQRRKPAKDELANPRLESRMREIRTSGSEGGAGPKSPVPTSIFGGKFRRRRSPSSPHEQ